MKDASLKEVIEMLHRNEGALDRAVRLALGIVLLPGGLLLLDGLQGGVLGLVLAAIGLFGLVSGTTGFCPLYLPFGFSTAGRRRSEVRLNQ
jgi:hypothetical protein